MRFHVSGFLGGGNAMRLCVGEGKEDWELWRETAGRLQGEENAR